MDENIVEQRKRATEVFKLGARALKVAVHRTINQPPKGDGWVQCWNSPPGLMCRPDKVREAIEHFEKAYEILPDIVALNQIALCHEMIGDADAARASFTRMREQALALGDDSYLRAADLGLQRVS